MAKPVIYGAIGGGVTVAIAVIVLFVIHPYAPQYALSVEPRTEEAMGVGSLTRLYLTNTGSQPLTNIKVDYNGSSDSLPILNPGEKVMLSPPASANMATVSDDQGLTVTKEIQSIG